MMTTPELLAESITSAQIREKAEFEKQLEEAGGKIVLYGAGSLGRKVVVALRNQGIEAVAFADCNIRLHGEKVEGTSVFSPEAAAERWRENSLFVVTIFLPNGGGIQSRLNDLKTLGCKYTSTFLELGWRYDGVLPHFGADLPSNLLSNSTRLEEVANLWSDDISAETYRQALAWRLRAQFDGIKSPAPNQYFPRDILRPIADEVFVDGGAFNGDTIRSAPWQLSRVLAIEPDPKNVAMLRASEKQGVKVHEVLLGNEHGFARFNGTGTMASSRSNTGSLQIAVTTLDRITTGENPTFIKLDVEGDELAALQGGMNTLIRCQPVVAVCVYHRPEDLWKIPHFLHKLLPQHEIFMRAHAFDGFELVVYAVPSGRCLLSI